MQAISSVHTTIKLKTVLLTESGRVGVEKEEGVGKDLTVCMTMCNPKLKVNPPVNFIRKFQDLI